MHCIGHFTLLLIVITSQVMHCILCYNNPILNLNPKTQAKRRLIIYNTTNGITTLIEYVNLDHFNISKILKKK
jgi:hypothetical protein